MMIERPILFSAEMVIAILEGRKTQTRRVVKVLVSTGQLYRDGTIYPHDPMVLHAGDWYKPNEWSPFGVPGDRLWVRETWLPDPPQDDTWNYYDYTDGVLFNLDALPKRFRNPKHVIYRASFDGLDLRWRPSIFMPRWASRITLEIVNIRVERLQEISEEDAINEGIEVEPSGNAAYHRWKYSHLWDSLNSKRGYSWESNPWVWVIEFKRIGGEE